MTQANGGEAAEKQAQKKTEETDELSEEDSELKERIELCVQRTADADASVVANALQLLTQEIKSSTSSLSSVPKPLKFLRPHYETLKANLQKMQQSESKASAADILSLLAMTKRSSADAMPESLMFRLQGSQPNDVGMWGHEYVRNLASEVGIEYKRRQERDGEAKTSIADLQGVLRGIVSFHMQHNAEPEAIDLLMEVDAIDMITEYVTPETCSRVGLYLTTCASYLPEPDDAHVLRVAHQLYMEQKRWQEAMRIALKLNSQGYIEQTFNAQMGKCERRQLAYMLARHGHPLDLEEGNCKPSEDADELKEIMANTRMSEFFQALAKDLDVLDPKTPEDIYKSHLVEGRQPSTSAIDSASQNLSATFVSAFVNAGFGKDKLMTVHDSEIEGNIPWVYKNKDHGRASAAASLGLVKLWDVEGGLPEIDKYLYAQESEVVAGALMGVGIVSSNVRNEADPAYALLHDSVNQDSTTIRIGALLGLGVAYAGTARNDIGELVSGTVEDAGTKIDLACFASLTLGLVFVGTGDSGIAESLLTACMTREDLHEPLTRLICLALGLVFLGRKSDVDATVEVAKSMDPAISSFLQVVLEACAYAGTGYVVKVQEMLQMCSIGTTSFKQEGENDQQRQQQQQQQDSNAKEKGKSAADYQAPAVLGMAMIAMGEELGSEMAIRTVEHLLQYGDDHVRKACPLALALVSTSNPKIAVTDTLSRLSHDSNKEVAQAATLAIGLVSAGTNNARVAGMLRQLTSYYYKDPSLLFLVRVSQGLVHLGKGLLTLSPFHSDRGLISNVSLASLLCIAFCGIDMEKTLLSKYHYCLYLLTPAITPRMLYTVDEEGKALNVSVRVGEAVDVVAQAGRPKSITGFQTHTTPVLMGVNDRAELATDEYEAYTPYLEGVTIMRKAQAQDDASGDVSMGA